MALSTWLLVIAGSCLALYVALVLALVLLGRRESARAIAGFVPDCLVLFRRMLGDPRLDRTVFEPTGVPGITDLHRRLR